MRYTSDTLTTGSRMSGSRKIAHMDTTTVTSRLTPKEKPPIIARGFMWGVQLATPQSLFSSRLYAQRPSLNTFSPSL